MRDPITQPEAEDLMSDDEMSAFAKDGNKLDLAVDTYVKDVLGELTGELPPGEAEKRLVADTGIPELGANRDKGPLSWIREGKRVLGDLIEPFNGSIDDPDAHEDQVAHQLDFRRINRARRIPLPIPRPYISYASIIGSFLNRKANVDFNTFAGCLMIVFNQEVSMIWPPPTRSNEGDKTRFGALQMTVGTARTLTNQYGIQSDPNSIVGRSELYTAYFSQAHDVLTSKTDFSSSSMNGLFPDFCGYVTFEDEKDNLVFSLLHYHRAGLSRKYVLAQPDTWNDIIARLPTRMLNDDIKRGITSE
jgi:hypothetical protein